MGQELRIIRNFAANFDNNEAFLDLHKPVVNFYRLP